MGKDVNYDILKSSGLFELVLDQNIPMILKDLMAKKREYKKGEVLYRTTDHIHEIGIVLSGKIHMLSVDLWGRKFIFAEYSKGALFGESHSMVSEEPLMFDIVAVEKTEILGIDIKRIIEISKDSSRQQLQLTKNLMKLTARKKIAFLHKIDTISRKSLRDKVISYLSIESQKCNSRSFDIPFNRQEMADYLSADRSALSNELGKMKKEGMIDFSNNHFYIRDLD